MPMDSSISAEDESSRNAFSVFETVQDFYVNTAASEAINNLR